MNDASNSRKNAAHIACCLAVLLGAGAAQAEPPAVPQYDAVKMAQRLKIDGVLNDWLDATPIFTDAPQQRRVTPFTSLADINAIGYVAWDALNLYVAIVVMDDHHVQQADRGGLYWEGDSVQVALDLTNNVLGPKVEHELEVALLADGPAMFDANGADLTHAQLAIRPTGEGGGLVYEIATPWAALGAYRPTSGNPFSLNFLVNDADPDEARVWVNWTGGIAESKHPAIYPELTPVEPTDSAAPIVVKVSTFKEACTTEDALAGEVTVLSRRPHRDTSLVIEALHDDEVLWRQDETLHEEPGIKTFAVNIAADRLASGAVTLRAQAQDDQSHETWSDQVVVRVISEAGLKQRMSSAAERVQALRNAMAKQPKDETAYSAAATAIAEHFLDRLPEQLAQKEALKADRWMEQIEQLLDEAEGPLTHRGHVPDPSITGLTIRDGSFKSGEEAVFLFGPVGWYGASTLPYLSDMGFRLAGGNLAIDYVFPSPNEYVPERMYHLPDCAEVAADLNIAYDVLLNLMWGTKPWFIEQNPGTATDRGDPSDLRAGHNNFMNLRVNDPRVRNWMVKVLDTITPVINRPPGPFSIDMENEVAYLPTNDFDSYSVAAFRAWLPMQYKSIADLSRVYNKGYHDWNEVEPAPWRDPLALPSHNEITDAAWYDWLRYNELRAADYYRWFSEQVRQRFPGLPVHLKVGGIGGGHRGMDMEAIVSYLDIVGFDLGAKRLSPNDAFATRIWETSVAYDLLRAMCPDKPLFNSEQHLGLYPWSDPAYTYAQVIEPAIHGLDMGMFWVFSAQGYDGLQMEHEPNISYGLSLGTLDLRRVAPIVQSFQEDRSPIAVLYSPTSVIARNNYSPWLASYGLFWQDAGCTFVTERTLLERGMEQVKLLVVPDDVWTSDEVYSVIFKFAESGGHVALCGRTLERDERGGARNVRALTALPTVTRLPWLALDDGVLPDMYRVDVSNQLMEFDYPQLWRQVQRMDEAFSPLVEQAGITSRVRLLDSEGGRPLGVELRWVEHNGDLYAFVMNHLAESMQLQLRLDDKPATGEDVLNSEPIATQFELAPGHLVLVRLTPDQSTER